MKIATPAVSAVAAALGFLWLPAAAPDEIGDSVEERGAIAELTAGGHDLTRLGSTRIQWPEASEIESFFALGFSADGWFAHADRLRGLCLEETAADCRGDAARFEVSLFNVTCERRCRGDVDPTAGEVCECHPHVTVRELEALGVGPREALESGDFPARFGAVEYDVELIFRENAIYPMMKAEPWVPELPETRAYLIDGVGNRRLIAAIDHNHMAVAAGLRVAGWFKHPDLDYLVVLLLARETHGLAPRWVLRPFAVGLGDGSR